MKNTTILWVDDEIDLLKAHLLFLEQKGYNMLIATNGDDAIKIVEKEHIDLIFLDENMPGRSGLDTLTVIKQMHNHIPIVMITKSEEEDIMDHAIGSKINDYLIKPVNPSQILLTIKKHIDNRRLVNEQTNSAYRSEFQNLSFIINSARNYNDWIEIYKKLTYWELQLERTGQEMTEVLKMQKIQANSEFARFIKTNYPLWFKPDCKDKPLLSPGVIKQSVLPMIQQGTNVLLLIIDNLRYDQWQTIAPQINKYCKIEKEELYFSILPTVTQYARNSMFAGLMPLDIQKLYPNLWIEDEEEEPKNINEEELLKSQMNRLAGTIKISYNKILNLKYAKKYYENFSNIKSYNFNVAVFNFVDTLSHAGTDTDIVKELAFDDAAYRSITLSWFKHSYLPEILRECTQNNIKVVITTDHGTIKVNNPIKVVGDRNTSSNLRYKLGRNLDYNPKEVFEIRKPSDIHLPSTNMTSSYIFAYPYDFLVYPTNYNHFVNYYKNSFQHGGISMEEMIIPLITLSAK